MTKILVTLEQTVVETAVHEVAFSYGDEATPVSALAKIEGRMDGVRVVSCDRDERLPVYKCWQYVSDDGVVLEPPQKRIALSLTHMK